MYSAVAVGGGAAAAATTAATTSESRAMRLPRASRESRIEEAIILDEALCCDDYTPNSRQVREPIVSVKINNNNKKTQQTYPLFY